MNNLVETPPTPRRRAQVEITCQHRPGENMRRGRALVFRHWSFACLFALVLGLSGCATSTGRPVTVSLKATGDPGVSVRVRTTIPGVPEQVAQVPAELTFGGKSFDLYCLHGPQPGRLNLIISRGGISMSTADTTRPGEVTHFVVRQDSLSIGTPEGLPTK